ncbi:hypothetical protein [Endozoicomonas atrinae]|uniref:hypothetical protein n=1 Tax=Endozoicomonas atrinae TaxID=1333660 RepID=UPI003B00E81A
MPFPFDIPDNEKSELISKILKYTTRTQEENAQLKERVNILEQEIHRLKGLNGKPDIKPNTPKNDDSSSKPGDDNDAGAGHQKRDTGKPDERTKKKRKKPPKPSNPIRKRVAPVNIPEGSEYKGLNLYGVQEITFTVSLIQYELEHWVTPDGDSIYGRLPESVQGYHFGPELRSYVLHQHHACGVTEQQLLESLWDRGVSISAGELSNLLTLNHDDFHAEKDDLLTTGLFHCPYLQVDDTGARHQGQNGYCTFIGSPEFGNCSKSVGKTFVHVPIDSLFNELA